MDKAMDNHCNECCVTLRSQPWGTPHVEQTLVEGTIPDFPKFLWCLKASKDYSSHEPPPEGPVEVRKERESIPLLLIASFSPQKLRRKAVGSERFLVLFQIIKIITNNKKKSLRTKKNSPCINIRV